MKFLSADRVKVLLLSQELHGLTVTASLLRNTDQCYWFQWRRWMIWIFKSLLIKVAFPSLIWRKIIARPSVALWPLNPWLCWPFTQRFPLIWYTERAENSLAPTFKADSSDAAVLTVKHRIFYICKGYNLSTNTKRATVIIIIWKLLILQSSFFFWHSEHKSILTPPIRWHLQWSLWLHDNFLLNFKL